MALVLLGLANEHAQADRFQDDIKPYLQKFCTECHGKKDPKGGLDLTAFESDQSLVRSFRKWDDITTFIRSGEMPPKGSPQPEIEQSNRVLAAVESVLLKEARKHAGDPGFVPPRRLSNTEYDHSIRDLTGVDIQPTRTFPPDPAGGEGFDNTGEALSMSPNLLKKYLSAAEEVASHLLLKTDGATFVKTPAVSYNERRKLTELAIIDFYNNRKVDIRQYVEAAWRYRYLEADIGLSSYATDKGLSPKYLNLVFETLVSSSGGDGFMGRLGQFWDAVPMPENQTHIPAEFNELLSFIEFSRKRLTPELKGLIKSNAGNWPIHWLDFRAKTASVRDQFSTEQLKPEQLVVIGRVPEFSEQEGDISIFIHIDEGFVEGNGFVLIERPVFSDNRNLPKNDDEFEKHNVISLQDVLGEHQPELAQQLQFGVHPMNSESVVEIAEDSLVLKTGARIEIRLDQEAQQRLRGQFLLLPFKLDGQFSKSTSVFVQASLKTAPLNTFSPSAHHLIYRESQAAESLSLSAARFCSTFPNRFFYVDDKRGLAAGFHLVEGFFRDDKPLVDKVLSDTEVADLNNMWEELDFVTNRTETLLRGFVWFERSERHVLHGRDWDYLRAEDPALVTAELLERFEVQYLKKMGTPSKEGTEEASRRVIEPENPSEKFDMVHGFFESIRAGLKKQQAVLAAAEPKGLADVLIFAARAYKRTLTEQELAGLRGLYQSLREDGQSVESSLRGLVTAVLMSPEFIFRYNGNRAGKGVIPLDDRDLANRLSYFLWSSVPDDELLLAADRQELADDGNLQLHAGRMLQDDRVEAFAREFFGQWLRFRDYLDKDPINPDAFPEYTDELRAAMWREPIELGNSIIRNDLPITTLINGDSTHVNAVLARHYGGEIQRQWEEARKQLQNHLNVTGQTALSKKELDAVWFEIDGLLAEGRGGLFGMAVILAKNSSGERTSPVKRGFWTVHHLLGQHFPPPPADVPELPDSVKDGEHSLRELLNAHVSDASCSICHKHFDYLGLAQESFDPIGRFRDRDIAGRPIDDAVTLPDGEIAKGIAGLIKYIEQHRQQEFIRTFCRKFLGYALGRSVELSDRQLLDEMIEALKANDYRFSALVMTVVESRQFRYQRARDFVTSAR